MAKHATQAIRAIALVGHGAAGKTTLTEALLHKAGAIPAAGSVDKGTSVCDFDPLEKEFKHSLASALVQFLAQRYPHPPDRHAGYPDFLGQSLNALAAVETAAVVINAQNGIEMVTQRMMQWARERGLCRLIIINKIDAENVDLPALLADIQARVRQRMPADQPAGSRRQTGGRLLFQPCGRADFSSVAEPTARWSSKSSKSTKN